MSQIGFTLSEKRHGPHDPQRLGYWWNEKDGTNKGVEFAVTYANDPELVAISLLQMAEAIRLRHREHRAKEASQ